MSKEQLLAELIELNSFLCPELYGKWSVTSIECTCGEPNFFGFGDTPEEALLNAKIAFANWLDKEN